MGLPTDSYIDVEIDEEVVDRIGLSAPLSNISDIIAGGYCGMHHLLWRNGQTKTTDADYTVSKTIPVELSGNTFPITVSKGYGAYNYPDGMFCGIVWLYSENSPMDYCINSSNIGDYKLVTEWDAPHYVFKPSPLQESGHWTGKTHLSWANNDSPGYVWNNGYNNNFMRLEYWDDNEGTNTVNIAHIRPYLMYQNENGSHFLTVYDYSYQATFFYADTDTYAATTTLKDYTDSENIAFCVAIDSLGSPNILPATGSSYGFINAEGMSVNDQFGVYMLTSSSSISGHSGYFAYGTEYAFHFKDDVFTDIAGCGLKFYTDKLYKPIISGGVVIGYTDDMDEESELDEWTGTTDHGIGPTPPTPPPGPGYDDDPWHGATFAGTGVGGAGAFAKVYYMTSTELANLRSWMNSINVPEGFDPMQQIIGLSQVPVALSGSGPENVVFVNSSAVYDPGVTTRAVDTGVATQQAMGTPISYYLGSVDIVRRMQERGEPYLDYDCQIELYLPLIGMFSLDTQAVMGRTISAYAVLDPVSGTLAAYAYVTKDGQNLPIAYGSTTIGVDLPISAQQLSVSRAALKQANAQLGASLLSGALTMLAAASSSGKSSGSGAKTSTGSSGLSAAGIREAGSDYMKASQVGNVFGDFMNWGRTIRQLSYGNNTAIAGSFGGSSAQWAYPFTPYVKIIRPRFEKPSNYAHSQGVPCVQTKTIGSCTGFIQCIGADVSGITGATDLELQAIQAALSNGIYAGGGS